MRVPSAVQWALGEKDNACTPVGQRAGGAVDVSPALQCGGGVGWGGASSPIPVTGAPRRHAEEWCFAPAMMRGHIHQPRPGPMPVNVSATMRPTPRCGANHDCASGVLNNMGAGVGFSPGTVWMRANEYGACDDVQTYSSTRPGPMLVCVCHDALHTEVRG